MWMLGPLKMILKNQNWTWERWSRWWPLTWAACTPGFRQSSATCTSLPPSTGRGLARGGGVHCGGKCFNVMNIFRERIMYICNYIYTYLRIYIYAKVPAVETDGEKENDANGSEWEVEEVKLGTSVLLPAPGFTNWIHDAYHIISYFNGEGLGR